MSIFFDFHYANVFKKHFSKYFGIIVKDKHNKNLPLISTLNQNLNIELLYVILTCINQFSFKNELSMALSKEASKANSLAN